MWISAFSAPIPTSWLNHDTEPEQLPPGVDLRFVPRRGISGRQRPTANSYLTFSENWGKPWETQRNSWVMIIFLNISIWIHLKVFCACCFFLNTWWEGYSNHDSNATQFHEISTEFCDAFLPGHIQNPEDFLSELQNSQHFNGESDQSILSPMECFRPHLSRLEPHLAATDLFYLTKCYS